MPSETDETTIVSKWLKALGAAKYTKVFFDRGYKELEEVTKDVIERLVEDKPLAAKLVASATALNDLRPGPNPQPIGGSGSVGIPPLPPGTTLDLTHPTHKVSGVEFRIPDALSVDSTGTGGVSPNSLSTGDWIVLAKNNNFFRAYTLDDPGNNQGEPPRATTLALDYFVPTSDDFLQAMHLIGRAESAVAYSSATASYVRAGFDTQSASLSIPYAAASFERQSKEREAKASTHKTIYMFGSWYYPKAKLFPKKFTKASTRFTAALEAALTEKDPAAALEREFNTYGRAVPEEVVVGGQLFFVHQEVCDGIVSETEVEQTIKVAVTAKYDGVAASAGVGFGSGSSSKVTAEKVANRTTFEVRGGNAILATNPKQWPATVDDPNKWAVIRVSKVAPITDWLEPDLRARVERFFPAIEPPQYVSAEDHTARADSDGFILGVRTGQGFGTSTDAPVQLRGVRGGLELVCGTSGSPALSQVDAVGASATFHGSNPDDKWIDGVSICLPVPKGSHYSVKKWDDHSEALSRFTKSETKLTFGKWEMWGGGAFVPGLGGFKPAAWDSDGFIFCSVQAHRDGDRGFVSCTVDGKILGAASVHNCNPNTGCSIPDACFCVPVPRHLQMSLDPTVSYGQLDIKVWYLASTSQAWKFGTPELYSNALHTAETDGFLSGVVTVRQGDARGMLFLYCGPDNDHMMGVRVAPAMIAVNQTSNRRIPYASAMLPVRKGFVFRPRPDFLSPGATVEAYWTPLLHVA